MDINASKSPRAHNSAHGKPSQMRVICWEKSTPDLGMHFKFHSNLSKYAKAVHSINIVTQTTYQPTNQPTTW